MNKNYEKLDAMILDAIFRGDRNPMYDKDVFVEAWRIGEETGRKRMRVINGRLTALRKLEKIKYLKKAEAPKGKTGWYFAIAT